MIEAVIFDMDGVIVDSEETHMRLEKELFETLGINVNPKEHESYVGASAYYMWGHLIKKHNLPYTVDELVKMKRSRYFELLTEGLELEPIEGVLELINDLHKNGLKLAIASSSAINVIELITKKFKIDGYFNKLISGDWVADSKPAPGIFLLAAKELGVALEKCIVIEDSNNGARAAKAAGMKCIGFRNPNSGNQDLSMADMIINKFSEIGSREISCI